MVHPVPPGAMATTHEPRSAPGALAHSPPQHSVSFEHASPVCTQNDEPAAQVPPVQRREQHSVGNAHGLPVDLHVADRGVQLLVPPTGPSQRPLQHDAASVHTVPSATHAPATISVSAK